MEFLDAPFFGVDDEERRRRNESPSAPTLNMPPAPEAPRIPTPTPGTQENRPKTARDYGIDSDAPAAWQRFDNTGFYYDWRAQPYQSPLGQGDIDAQRREYSYRAENPTQKLPEDSAGLARVMGGAPQINTPTLGPRPPAPPPAPPSSHGGNIFDDPASRLIEDYSLDRFNQRQNPDPESGTARFESYIRELIETLRQPSAYESYLPELAEQLKQPVYSDQQSSQLKADVYDNIEVNRDQTKQRWLQEVSRRGFAPSSGPALEGLLRIDEQFNTMRTVADREFAVNAIDLTEQRRFQVADALRGSRDAERERTGSATRSLTALADSEESRLREAGTYAAMPKQLADTAFQQGLQLVGAGGSPQSALSSALSIYNAVSQNNNLDRARRDASLEAIFEFIAGLEF